MRSQTITPIGRAGRGVRPHGLLAAELLLVGAALLIGLAIVSDPMLGRVLNGVGGVLWIGSAGLLAWRLRAEPNAPLLAALTATAAVVLAAVVRPDNLTAAVVGFGLAGAVAGRLATRHAASWAMLVPAIYLPAHVLLAIARSLVAGSVRVRTEPPPTAAVVPLAMVLAAALAGLAVSWLRARGR